MREKKMYQYWFLSNQDIPYTSKYKFYNYFYDAYHIFHATEEELKLSGLLSEEQIRVFLDNRSRANLELMYSEFSNGPFSFVTLEDDDFPNNLRNIYDPPYGLFYNGKLPSFRKSVSIVGARRCSEYGKHIASVLAQHLAERGYTVVSGMARGIDSFAHKGCLNGHGQTVAVLGSGVDVVYPKENRLLYEEIAANGAVISEFPIGFEPRPVNFPIRNRIVAGLSDSLIVVEARLKSGSLITADLALEQGRDIYVVPGRVGDKLSEGCNRLVTQGAGLIYSIEQFLNELDESQASEGIEGIELVNDNSDKLKLSKEQLLVYSYFDYYPKSLAKVQAESGIDYLKLISIVAGLANEGLLNEVFKNHYTICG